MFTLVDFLGDIGADRAQKARCFKFFEKMAQTENFKNLNITFILSTKLPR